jgi:hypothetical protein
MNAEHAQNENRRTEELRVTRGKLSKSHASLIQVTPDEARYKRSNYLHLPAQTSISDILHYMKVNHPEVDYADMHVTGYNSLVWVDDATFEEITAAEKRREEGEARRESWERKTLADLKAKYENQEDAS